MQLKLLGGRSDLDVGFTVCQNLTTATAIVGNAVYWGMADQITTAAMQGKAVTDQTSDYSGARRLAGVWYQPVVKFGYGMVQNWGMGQVYVVTGTTGPQHGDILIAASGTAYTGATAGLVVGVRSNAAANAQEAFPHAIIISAATAGTFNLCFIRCLH